MATLYEVVQTAQAVVDEFGSDFLYVNPVGYCPGEVQEGDGLKDQRCYYVHRDDNGESVPGCIAGHIFNRLGVDLEELASLEHKGADTVVRVVGWPYETEEYLRVLQAKQDAGATWGEALDYAEGSM